MRRQPRQVPAGELDAPARAHEAGDRVDERRLARAVGTDETDEPALLDVEVDVDDRAHPTEADRHAARAQAHRSSTGCGRGAGAAAFAAASFFFWYCEPAIPSGNSRRFRTSVTPATSSVHVPEIPSSASKMCGIRPEVASSRRSPLLRPS
jgi:hypothetical protein